MEYIAGGFVAMTALVILFPLHVVAILSGVFFIGYKIGKMNRT